MALSTTDFDISTITSGISLPKELSDEVISKVQDESFVMQLAHNMTIPGRGEVVPVITGDPTPAWKGGETHEGTVSTGSYASKNMAPAELEVIVPFSKKFMRDMPGLYEEITSRLPRALARKIDETILGSSAPITGFDVIGDGATTMGIGSSSNVYRGLVNAKRRVAKKGGRVNGWGLSAVGETELEGAVDGSNRPIFNETSGAAGESGRILGAPAYVNGNLQVDGVDGAASVVGICGDWSKAVCGIVHDIQVEYSDQATLNDGTNTINLWQDGMFALKCNVEMGFVTASDDYFVILTDATPALVMAASTLTVSAGSTGSVVALESYGTLTAASSATGKATVAVSGNTVTVTGVASGSATITVTDGGTGSTATIAVTVSA